MKFLVHTYIHIVLKNPHIHSLNGAFLDMEQIDKFHSPSKPGKLLLLPDVLPDRSLKKKYYVLKIIPISRCCCYILHITVA